MVRLLALLAGLGAGQASFAQSVQPSDWVLTEVDGKPVAYSATLMIDGTRLSGKAPCNRYSGEIRGTPPDITFGPIAATRMACDGLADETAYFEALRAVTQMVDEDGTLTLTGPAHVLTFGLQVK